MSTLIVLKEFNYLYLWLHHDLQFLNFKLNIVDYLKRILRSPQESCDVK